MLSVRDVFVSSLDGMPVVKVTVAGSGIETISSQGTFGFEILTGKASTGTSFASSRGWDNHSELDNVKTD